jgi:tetratricopeptide (TPR) repeat protein
MNFKKTTLKIILALILSVILFDLVLSFQYNPSPPDTSCLNFKYKYEEIYIKFFKKTCLPNKSISVYSTQRFGAKQQSFQIPKIKNTKRIFVLGESVAKDFFARENRYLKKLLGSLTSGEKFEIINCGMSAYDSYRVSLICREILNYDPDIIIVLSGNDEFYSPVRINLWAYRVNKLFQNSWIYRCLQKQLLAFYKNHSMPKGISPSNRLKDYENNLQAMIRGAKNKNIPIILCTLPVNFRDCAPGEGDPAWENRQFFLAWNALNKKDFQVARHRFEKFIISRPKDVFGHYFLAKCFDGLGNYAQAQKYYLKAIDLDATPGDRCPPQRNKIIRRLCTQEGAILIDLEQLFIKISPHGLTGKELFQDNCHWWKECDYLVRETIARYIIQYCNIYSKSAYSYLDNWQYNFDSKLQNFPGTISKRTSAEMFWLRTFNAIAEIFHFETNSIKLNERAISFLEMAYQSNPELFEKNFSNRQQLKEQLFNLISKMWWMHEFLPDFDKTWAAFLCHAGEFFRRTGKYSMAIEFFDESINLNSDLYFSYLGRGLAYYEIKDTGQVKKDFKELTKRHCQHPLIEFYSESLGGLIL